MANCRHNFGYPFNFNIIYQDIYFAAGWPAPAQTGR